MGDFGASSCEPRGEATARTRKICAWLFCILVGATTRVRRDTFGQTVPARAGEPTPYNLQISPELPDNLYNFGGTAVHKVIILYGKGFRK